MSGGLHFKTKAAADFVAAWRVLCAATPTPHFRDAFQKLPTELIPRVIVIEWAPGDKYIIRFMGTSRVEMWGKDLTGLDSIALMPNTGAQARANLATMLDHPCGMYHIAQYKTPTGREMEMENLVVPVGNDPGLPRRVLNFAEEFATTAYGAPAGEVFSVSQRIWLDVGAGVPEKPPQK